MSKDPIRFDDGTNLYAYVGNDPINYTDPTGLFAGSSVFQMVSPDINNNIAPGQSRPKTITSRVNTILKLGKQQDKVLDQRSKIPLPPTLEDAKKLKQLDKRETDLFNKVLDEANIFNNLQEPNPQCQG